MRCCCWDCLSWFDGGYGRLVNAVRGEIWANVFSGCRGATIYNRIWTIYWEFGLGKYVFTSVRRCCCGRSNTTRAGPRLSWHRCPGTCIRAGHCDVLSCNAAARAIAICIWSTSHWPAVIIWILARKTSTAAMSVRMYYLLDFADWRSCPCRVWTSPWNGRV